MSKQRAIDALNGVMSDKIAQSSPIDSVALAEQVLDYDIWEDPERSLVDLHKYVDIDLATAFGGIAEWNFPLVRYYADVEFIQDDGCEAYREAYHSGTGTVVERPYQSMEDELGRKVNGAYWGISPTLTYAEPLFTSPEEVLLFNPLEHDRHSLEERTEFFRSFYKREMELAGDSALVYGWYYNTLFMWPVEIFGWENFMMASMMDPERFSEILRQFLQITKRDMQAMCAVDDLLAIGCHDDLCSAKGPMFSPDWYDENIFPAYQEIFDIIHDAGKKIIYTIDGNVIPLLDRIYDAGVDGIAVDSNSDLATVVEKFTGKIIVGGLDPAVISQGGPEDIEKQVVETVQIVKNEPGFFFQNTGMTGYTSAENILYYQQCLDKYGVR